MVGKLDAEEPNLQGATTNCNFEDIDLNERHETKEEIVEQIKDEYKTDSTEEHKKEFILDFDEETLGQIKDEYKTDSNEEHKKEFVSDIKKEETEELVIEIVEQIKDSVAENMEEQIIKEPEGLKECKYKEVNSRCNKDKLSNEIKISSAKKLEESRKLEKSNVEINSNKDSSRKRAKISAYMKKFRKQHNYGPHEVIVPVIGKHVFEKGDDTPFVGRYDLAIERNRLRAEYRKKHRDSFVPTSSMEEWRRQRESRTKEQIEEEECFKTVDATRLAKAFLQISIKILKEYQKDEPNEKLMMKYLKFFSFAPVSPLSLLYAPHIVHTVMLCRIDTKRSAKLRRLADRCYNKCHCLFGIPEGYNFETVFTSEIKKNIPDDLYNLDELEMYYGEYDSSDLSDHSD